MKTKHILFAHILILVFISVSYSSGCANEENTLSTGIVSQKVIFGDDYEERDQLVDRAETEINSDSKRDKWWQLATLSKTSGNVRLKYKSGPRLFGSATLTSAGLLFSADHVIYDQTHLPASEAIEAQYITFEMDWSTPDSNGGLAALKSDWYMYLRLKALGLDDWAIFRRQPYYQNLFEQWQWQEIENWEGDDEDIALIKVKPKLIKELQQLPKWQILEPNMFF